MDDEILTVFERFEVVWPLFGDSPEMATELADLVMAGIKRATASLARDYGESREPMPQPGDFVIMLDGVGRPRFIWQTTEVTLKPLSEVDEAFASDPAWDQNCERPRLSYPTGACVRGSSSRNRAETVRFSIGGFAEAPPIPLAMMAAAACIGCYHAEVAFVSRRRAAEIFAFRPEHPNMVNPRGVSTTKTPFRQRARSCETPSGSRPRVGPPRSPASSSGAPQSRTVACGPWSRTSEPIHL
jgi:hypothetical protein